LTRKHLATLFYSAGGVIALVVILIAVNFLLGTLNARVDLTQGSVYTLSQGTKAIVSKLEAPVKIRLYYSQGSSVVPVGLKTFAKRVEDLLSEFERAGNGKVIIEKLNPEPDSDAEDSAVLDGIEGQLTNTQEKFYLGLAVSFLDQQPDMQNPLGGNAAGQSTFYHLLKHWGYGMEMGKVAADLTYASGAGPRILPTLLSLSGDALNKEDVVASQVGTLLLPFASVF